MRHILFPAAAAAVCLCAGSANAQLLFGFEAGEPGLPYAGNPPPYVVTTTSTAPPVTQGTQAINAALATGQFFGGPGSAAFTDAGRATTINNVSALLIDMTVPDPNPGINDFNFGNIDMTFFQTNIRPGFDADETGFSSTFALSDGQTITLQIPLTNTQFGTPHITLNPALPWSYQINLSFGRSAANTGPNTFGFDNIRVVPEPATLLSGCALGGLLLGRRRR